jgi:hypothetical protein
MLLVPGGKKCPKKTRVSIIRKSRRKKAGS